ncbi:hypothetical protein GCM10008931_16200 [Oceanobacillus oncorhynchi subsp. oncorhynchi]
MNLFAYFHETVPPVCKLTRLLGSHRQNNGAFNTNREISHAKIVVHGFYLYTYAVKITSKNISGEIMSKKVTCISLTDGKTPYANGYTASFYHI